MANDTENLDSSNEDTTVESNDSTVAPEEDLQKLKETNRQLFERAKKAETEAKELREKIKTSPSKESEKPAESQPSSYDDERLDRLELRASGITHPDDQKIVLDEAKRLKLNVSEVADMEHMKAKLTASKEEREAQDGLPRGSKRAGGLTKHDVEYFLANPDKRPDDQELAEKVLDAKMNKERNANKFSDIMFTG